MTTLENGGTLVANLDESLIADDYEVIEPHVDTSLDNQVAPPAPASVQPPNASVSQWSIQQSITLDGNLSINTFPHPEEEQTLERETPVLDGSVIEGPGIQESLRSECEETLCSSWGSNDTLNGMLAAQAETKQLLESSIAKIETMKEELGQLDELKKTVEMLQKELAAKTETATLHQQETAKINILEEELYQKGLQIDQMENTQTAVRRELEVSQRTIADLQHTAKYLNDQLDEMCAKFLHEKELRAVVEEQLNAHHQGRPVLYDENAAARELSSQSAQLEQKEKEIKNMDEELKTRDEIIKVLREDHLEGNRQLAESSRRLDEAMAINRALEEALRIRKISEFEEMVEKMDERLMLDSS